MYTAFIRSDSSLLAVLAFAGHLNSLPTAHVNMFEVWSAPLFYLYQFAWVNVYASELYLWFDLLKTGGKRKSSNSGVLNTASTSCSWKGINSEYQMDYSEGIQCLLRRQLWCMLAMVALLREFLLGFFLCWKFDLSEGMEQQVEVFVELSYQGSLAWECLTS